MSSAKGTPQIDRRDDRTRSALQADAEQIRQQMARVRGELKRDLSGISREVQEAGRWQYYVEKFPFACTGLAVLAGYALIPSRKPVPITVTDEQIKGLAEAGQLHIVGEPAPAQQAGLGQKLGLMLGTMAARAIMSYGAKLLAGQAPSDRQA